MPSDGRRGDQARAQRRLCGSDEGGARLDACKKFLVIAAAGAALADRRARRARRHRLGDDAHGRDAQPVQDDAAAAAARPRGLPGDDGNGGGDGSGGTGRATDDRTSMTGATSRGPARGPRGRALRAQARDRRPGRDARAPARRAARRRPRAARGRARPGQDADRQDARRRARRHRSGASSSRPTSCPSDLVGTRIYRPGHGPLRHRARPGVRQLPARRRDQPRARQGAVRAARGHAGAPGHDRRRDATRCREPFLVLATQNPIESEGTYPLPEAQVDRFLFKLLVDYPTVGEEAAVVGRAIGDAGAGARARCRSRTLERYREIAPRRVRRPRRDRLRRRAGRRDPPPGHATGCTSSSGLIEYGASPRGPIGLVQAAQALALLRGRNHVVAEDVADLAADVLRHRLVLTYDALGDGVARRRPARPHPRHRRRRPRRGAHASRCAGMSTLARRPARAPGPGPDAGARSSRRSTSCSRAARPACCRASAARPGAAPGTELAQIRPYQVGDDVRRLDAAASARTGVPHVRDHVPERTLTTWVLARRLRLDGVRHRRRG